MNPYIDAIDDSMGMGSISIGPAGEVLYDSQWYRQWKDRIDVHLLLEICGENVCDDEDGKESIDWPGVIEDCQKLAISE